MPQHTQSRTAVLAAPASAATIRAVGVVGFTLALAAASQVSIPLPGTPVPLTLQPFIVVLAGLWLGPVAAATSMAIFLAAGAAGLPVFTPGGAPGIARFAGATGGYLLAYPLAAWMTGLVAGRFTTFAGRAIAATAGMAIIHLGGMTQLALITGSMAAAVSLGVLPFLGLDLAKAVLAAGITGRGKGSRPA
jgi:biotin transport system substrate-specific component